MVGGALDDRKAAPSSGRLYGDGVTLLCLNHVPDHYLLIDQHNCICKLAGLAIVIIHCYNYTTLQTLLGLVSLALPLIVLSKTSNTKWLNMERIPVTVRARHIHRRHLQRHRSR